MADKILDVRGFSCPIPVLKTKKNISEVSVGGTLEVLASDPGSFDDLQAFCHSTGHTLIEHSEASGVYRYLIKRMS